MTGATLRLNVACKYAVPPSLVSRGDKSAAIIVFMTTPNAFTIRPATSEDVVAIYALVRDLAIYEKLDHLMVSTPQDFDRELFGSNARIECIMAIEDDTAVGFALFFHNFSTFLGRKGLYLEDLFVKPECRGKGYGKALLVRLAQIAVERNCGRFEWSVLDWNTPSIDFYRAMGATVMQEWNIVRAAGDALTAMAAMKVRPSGGRKVAWVERSDAHQPPLELTPTGTGGLRGTERSL